MVLKSRIRSSVVSVTTSATAIPTTALPGRQSILIHNDGAATVYIGTSTVTTTGATKGYPLAAGKDLPMDVGPNVVMYGIVVTGTVSVVILEGT